MDSSPQVSAAARPWLSLWIVIHFFILAICLVQNNGASSLVRRIQQLTSVYSITFAQDYGGRPMEMSTGTDRSQPHIVQVRPSSDGEAVWTDIQPPANPPLAWIDSRWHNFQHMLAIAATENNEELLTIILDHIARHALVRDQSVNAIRLIRPATLSYAQDAMYRQGKLPVDDLKEAVIYEARIVVMPDQQIRLLPVLEQTRRATSVEPVR